MSPALLVLSIQQVSIRRIDSHSQPRGHRTCEPWSIRARQGSAISLRLCGDLTIFPSVRENRILRYLLSVEFVELEGRSVKEAPVEGSESDVPLAPEFLEDM